MSPYPMPIALGLLQLLAAVPVPAAETTIYVGKHFEVRDHDQPTKYVFNGSTRVARVTGSLSAKERIQRLRLRAGWNLASLAVTAPDFLGQLQELRSGPTPTIKALYRWRPATKDHGTIAPGESVDAGTVLWISARTDAVAAVRGEYVEPSQWVAPAGDTFVAVPALEAQPLTVPAGAAIWRYHAETGRWQAGLTGDLASLSDLPSALAPGEAIYVHATVPTDLGVPAPGERVRYYHQDHLGSSSVMTDAAGELVEETAFYPFGGPRHEHRLRPVEEPYKFTQKERDRESGLHYFEARYLAGSVARFLSVDPKYANLETATPDPQQLNLYAYGRNNPVLYVDPTGLDFGLPEVADSIDEVDAEATGEAVGYFLDNTWFGGMVKAPPGVSDVASFSGGIGDSFIDPLATFGGVQTFGMGFGKFARMSLGINNVDTTSPDYAKGGVLGTTVQFAMGAGELKAAISGLAGRGSTAAPGVIRSGTAAKSAIDPLADTVQSYRLPTYQGAGGAPTPKTLPGIRANNAAAEVARANARAAQMAENWNAAVNASPKSAWTQATIDATRNWRERLPTIEKKSDALRAIYEAADALFP